MLNVPIDRIVPLTDARDNFSRIVADIENQEDGLYVLTKGGKPAIALINISYLSELMNGTATLPQPHSKPTHHQPEVRKSEDKPIVTEKPVEISESPKVLEPKVITPEAPKTPIVQSNPINPTWTGQQPSNVQSNSTTPKNASPWPIAPSTPAANPVPMPNMAAPKPPISQPVALPKPPVPPPPPIVPPITAPIAVPSVTPVAPMPIAPPPPNPVSSSIPVPIKTTTDLPPPPNNPTSILFDEPPKTILEPGEEPAPQPINTVTPAVPTTQTANPSTTTPTPQASVSVQDIDI